MMRLCLSLAFSKARNTYVWESDRIRSDSTAMCAADVCVQAEEHAPGSACQESRSDPEAYRITLWGKAWKTHSDIFFFFHLNKWRLLPNCKTCRSATRTRGRNQTRWFHRFADSVLYIYCLMFCFFLNPLKQQITSKKERINFELL